MPNGVVDYTESQFSLKLTNDDMEGEGRLFFEGSHTKYTLQGQPAAKSMHLSDSIDAGSVGNSVGDSVWG